MKEDCIEWQFAKDWDGYGLVKIHRRMRRVHRVAWEIVNGAIPRGLFVCHRCDNPSCFNVNHLFLGSPADNMSDKTKKGRTPAGEEHKNSKHTSQDVHEMRVAFLMGCTQKAIGSVFGIRQGKVHGIISGKAWTSRA